MYLLSVTPMMLRNKCTKPSCIDQEPLCVYVRSWISGLVEEWSAALSSLEGSLIGLGLSVGLKAALLGGIF